MCCMVGMVVAVVRSAVMKNFNPSGLKLETDKGGVSDQMRCAK